MEIRLRVPELAILLCGFTAIGIIAGIMIGSGKSNSFQLVYMGLILFPMLTIIVRKRYKVRG